MKSIFISEDLESILARIEKLEPESEHLWGIMNVHQAVCHCSDAIRMDLGELLVPDVSNFFSRTFIKWLAMRSERIPKGSPTGRELDQVKGGGTAPTTFEQDRAGLKKLIEEFGSKPIDFKFAAHPFFGKLTRKQLGEHSYKHLDHHLRQFGC